MAAKKIADSDYPVLTLGDKVRVINGRTNHRNLEQFVTGVSCATGKVLYAVAGNAWFTRGELTLVKPCRTEKQLQEFLADRIRRSMEEEGIFDEDEDYSDSDRDDEEDA